jgi:hypothetical protein
MIAGFVFAMMVVVEYLNVVTRGAWQKSICATPWRQYSAASILGAVPGCLGAYTNVTFYTHGILSFGALVAGMIATSGDEAFVMFAMFPGKAILLMGILLVVGFVTGALTDRLSGVDAAEMAEKCARLDIREEHPAGLFCPTEIKGHLRRCSLQRGVLLIVLAVFAFALLSGEVGEDEPNWIRITSLVVSLAGLFVTATVPEHFLEEHLWNHVARAHLPRILLWTFGALLLITLGTHYLHVEGWIRSGPLVVLLVACLMGLIPQSGPHLVFVTLFAQGMIPFSVLLASSIVQDGHGMLPLLAHSRRDFVKVKVISFGVGLTVGLVGHLLKF